MEWACCTLFFQCLSPLLKTNLSRLQDLVTCGRLQVVARVVPWQWSVQGDPGTWNAISDVEAMDLLAKVGSDCPFFWKNEPAFVFGRGEKMRPIDLDLSGWKILLVNPSIHVSTKEAYAGITPSNPGFDLQMLSNTPIEGWKEVVKNDVEESIFPNHPKIGELKSWLYTSGAVYASMTGSGSTVYGIFEKLPSLPEEYSTLESWSGEL